MLNAKTLNHLLRFTDIQVREPITNIRICDTCKSEMTEGYVWGDGEGYACSDKCLYVDGYTKDLYKEDYKDGDIYWTTWED